MTADQYQRAKAIFQELLDVDDSTRASRLATLKLESPALAEEVESLLRYHTAGSLVAPPTAPKIRTRSTLSTTYQSSSGSWLKGTSKSLLFALPFFIGALFLGLWIHQRAVNALQSSLAAYLSESIDHRLSQFRQWEQEQVDVAVNWSRDPELVAAVTNLVAIAKDDSLSNEQRRDALESARYDKDIENKLQDLVGNSVHFSIWDSAMVNLASWDQAQQHQASRELGELGQRVPDSGVAMLHPVLKGQPKMSLPKLGRVVAENEESSQPQPVLSIFVPIVDDQTGNVVAAMMLRGYGLEKQYTAMLDAWTSRSLGETYLVNARGALITPSRYGRELLYLGLAIDDHSPSPSPLVRDPGVDLLNRERPEHAAAAWPLTLLARQVTSGSNGMNVDGYRNYVGQTVVGAWRWLPDHEIGIALEQDYHEAFGISVLVRNALLANALLFSLGLVGLTVAHALNARARRRLRDVSDVGPYQMQEVIGEGGMGRVYLAEHALLCRQSAVKVLTKGDNDLSVIGRFEREVQLASQLTHPNTISIYDFGRNKDGVFYYAMEYINGAHLGQLVEFTGPVDPGRCIYIIQQLCRALFEAHQAGVVHRDIKPQNIMVCNRGGEPDFLKLFDYGLVKAFAPGVSDHTSQTKIVVGTPRFMAPERLNSPWLADPRVDVYSVGALAYYLLTAQLPPLVTPADGLDAEHTGVETLDLPPSVVDFGELLSVCMAVEPSSRPSGMSSLIRELDELARKYPWTREDSAAWWSQHEATLLQLVHKKRQEFASSTDGSK